MTLVSPSTGRPNQRWYSAAMLAATLSVLCLAPAHALTYRATYPAHNVGPAGSFEFSAPDRNTPPAAVSNVAITFCGRAYTDGDVVVHNASPTSFLITYAGDPLVATAGLDSFWGSVPLAGGGGTFHIGCSSSNPAPWNASTLQFAITLIGATLTKTSGDVQGALVGNGYPVPLRVRLTDGAAPIPGETVTFAPVAGATGANAACAPASAVTDANGYAQTSCAATSAAGALTVRAQATPDIYTDFALTNLAQAPQLQWPAQTTASHSFAPGATFAIAPLATSDSPAPIGYSSDTPQICTVAGTTVTMVAAGTCGLRAAQPAAGAFAAAAATQTVLLAAAVPTLSAMGWLWLTLGVLGWGVRLRRRG